MKNKFAYLVMRLSLGMVFLIFGLGKFRNDIWAETIRSMDFFANLPWSVNASVLLVGAIEVLTGIALIAGVFTRFFAAIAAIQLTGILLLLKFGEIRDIGLLGMAIYMAAAKDDSFGIGRAWKRRRRGMK